MSDQKRNDQYQREPTCQHGQIVGHCRWCDCITKDAELSSLRAELRARQEELVELTVRHAEEVERLRTQSDEWQGASILNASALKRAATERDAAEARVAETVEMLGEMYDAWENGCPITEGGEPDGANLGTALDLTDDQNERILAILKKNGHEYAKPTHAELSARVADLLEVNAVQTKTMAGLVDRCSKLEAVAQAARTGIENIVHEWFQGRHCLDCAVCALQRTLAALDEETAAPPMSDAHLSLVMSKVMDPPTPAEPAAKAEPCGTCGGRGYHINFGEHIPCPSCSPKEAP